jgi:hypothetical protein
MELFDEGYLNQVVLPKENHFDTCFFFALGFIQVAEKEFSSEEIIEAYKSAPMPEVSEKRVWGAVIKRLKKEGAIEWHSFGVYHGKQGHGKPINIWRKK